MRNSTETTLNKEEEENWELNLFAFFPFAQKAKNY